MFACSPSVIFLCALAILNPLVAVLAVRETKFYDVLGVAPDAPDRALKKGYRKAALCGFLPHTKRANIIAQMHVSQLRLKGFRVWRVGL